MKSKELEAIEQALGVRLPAAYHDAMCGSDAPSLVEAGLFGNPDLVVSRTKEQRRGFGGASAWPQEFVSIGDQEDACPYALDTISGSIIQTDHGSLDSPPLARFSDFGKLVTELLETCEPQSTSSIWARILELFRNKK